MPNPNFVATVIAEGQRYTQWESVIIKRDIGIPFSTFQFTASEFTDGAAGWTNIRLKPGDPVQIMLGGVQIINGVITTRTANYDANSHVLVIAGKSRTEAIRSSVVIKPGTYNGYTFQQAAQAVLAPYGIGLTILNPPPIVSKPFKALNVQYGETVIEFIERMAMMRGLFLTDDSNGNLVALNSGPNDATAAQLVEGVNILKATCTLDDQEVYGVMSLVGQVPDPDSPTPPRDFSATVNNSSALTNKREVIVAEHPADTQDLIARANLEAARETWPTVRCEITVVGWFKDNGTLWGPPLGAPELVTVDSPMLFPNDSGSMQLYIKSCTYAQDSENGTTTLLGLVNKNGLSSALQAVTAGSNPVTDPSPPPAQADPPDTESP